MQTLTHQENPMSEIRVRNPALFDRLRLQALLRSIADQRGEAEMLRLLEQALAAELGKYSNETPTVHSHSQRSVE
jgi:hypothetical protein